MPANVRVTKEALDVIHQCSAQECGFEYVENADPVYGEPGMFTIWLSDEVVGALAELAHTEESTSDVIVRLGTYYLRGGRPQ
jgi:hypothetical protein